MCILYYTKGGPFGKQSKQPLWESVLQKKVTGMFHFLLVLREVSIAGTLELTETEGDPSVVHMKKERRGQRMMLVGFQELRNSLQQE